MVNINTRYSIENIIMKNRRNSRKAIKISLEKIEDYRHLGKIGLQNGWAVFLLIKLSRVRVPGVSLGMASIFIEAYFLFSTL